MGLMKPNFTVQYGIRPPMGEQPYSSYSAVDNLTTLTISDTLGLTQAIQTDTGSAAATTNIKVKRMYFTCFNVNGLGAGGQEIHLTVLLAGKTIYETYFLNVEGEKMEFEWDFEDTSLRKNDVLSVTVASAAFAFGESGNFAVAAGIIGLSF